MIAMASLSSNAHGKNLRNAVVAFLAPLPSIFFCLSFLRHYAAAEAGSISPLWTWCYQHPLLLANVLFFLNVNLLFWLLGTLQSSHWVRISLHFSFSRLHFLVLVFHSFLLVLCNSDRESVVSDDRFVLDGDSCVAGSLLLDSPVSRMQCLEIEARDSFDVGLVR